MSLISRLVTIPAAASGGKDGFAAIYRNTDGSDLQACHFLTNVSGDTIYGTYRTRYYESNDRRGFIKLSIDGELLDTKYIADDEAFNWSSALGTFALDSTHMFYSDSPSINNHFNKYPLDFSSTTAVTSKKNPADSGTDTRPYVKMSPNGFIYSSFENATYDYYVYKFDINGNMLNFLRLEPSPYYNIGSNKIYFDGSSNLYLMGNIYGGSGSTTYEAFVYKANSSLTVTGRFRFQDSTSANSPVIRDMTLDDSGNTYCVMEIGNIDMVVKVDPTAYTLSSEPAEHPQWAISYGSDVRDWYHIEYDSETGYLYAIASTGTQFDPLIITIDPSNGSVIASQKLTGFMRGIESSSIKEGEYLLLSSDRVNAAGVEEDIRLLKYPLGGVKAGTYNLLTVSDVSLVTTDYTNSFTPDTRIQPGGFPRGNLRFNSHTSVTKGTEIVSDDTAVERDSFEGI